MNKKEKSKLHRFINDNEFRTTFIGGGAEREVPVVDAQKLRRLIRRMNDQFEPQKVKVPAFVARAIENYREQGWSNSQIIEDAYNANISNKFTNWYGNVDGEHLFFDAVAFGYEVEEEPVWVIPLPKMLHNGVQAYLSKEKQNFETADNCDYDSMKFTNEELGEVPEIYRKLAIRIEKV